MSFERTENGQPIAGDPIVLEKGEHPTGVELGGARRRIQTGQTLAVWVQQWNPNTEETYVERADLEVIETEGEVPNSSLICTDDDGEIYRIDFAAGKAAHLPTEEKTVYDADAGLVEEKREYTGKRPFGSLIEVRRL